MKLKILKFSVCVLFASSGLLKSQGGVHITDWSEWKECPQAKDLKYSMRCTSNDGNMDYGNGYPHYWSIKFRNSSSKNVFFYYYFSDKPNGPKTLIEPRLVPAKTDETSFSNISPNPSIDCNSPIFILFDKVTLKSD